MTWDLVRKTEVGNSTIRVPVRIAKKFQSMVIRITVGEELATITHNECSRSVWIEYRVDKSVQPQ